MSEGDAPPPEQRKNVIFKVNCHDLVHSFCLSAKNRGGHLHSLLNSPGKNPFSCQVNKMELKLRDLHDLKFKIDQALYSLHTEALMKVTHLIREGKMVTRKKE